MSDNKIFDNLENRRAKVEQVAQNSARPGRALSIYTSTGVGTIFEPVCFNFKASFTTKPHFTFGSDILSDVSTMPVCVASVYKWRQSANGFYTGAWCAFYVGSSDSGAAALNIEFHLTWEGILIKDFISSLGFPVQSLDI